VPESIVGHQSIAETQDQDTPSHFTPCLPTDITVP
jgi:hypothetical protein